eukprot:8763728-Prorocentrum_lima.AAC.1
MRHSGLVPSPAVPTAFTSAGVRTAEPPTSIMWVPTPTGPTRPRKGVGSSGARSAATATRRGSRA